MYMYRVLTERINQDMIESLCNKYLGNCTILDGKGLFNNESEESTVIEYSTGTAQDSLIRELAHEIKTANSQEAVLIQKFNISQFVITG